MKKHAIIPIFIPHQGCPYACVFCDQTKITARAKAPSAEEVRATIDTWLTTLCGKARPETLEIAFYGGSFTGIPLRDQETYLTIAKEYKDAGLVDKIHLSTRPDYIDADILSFLKNHSVDVIELGCQSFDDRVLKASKRGHSAEDIRIASKAIKEAGFTLGIQLMIGLPGDSMESCIYSAMETVKLKPDLARLYPTVVISGTELSDMCASGDYIPISISESVARTKRMYEILDDAGINIMRVGLKSSDIINNSQDGAVLNETFHPAFRQLVESEIAKGKILVQLDEVISELCTRLIDGDESILKGSPYRINVLSSPSWFSNMIGQHGSNREYLSHAYPDFIIKFGVDGSLSPGEFSVSLDSRPPQF